MTDHSIDLPLLIIPRQQRGSITSLKQLARLGIVFDAKSRLQPLFWIFCVACLVALVVFETHRSFDFLREVQNATQALACVVFTVFLVWYFRSADGFSAFEQGTASILTREQPADQSAEDADLRWRIHRFGGLCFGFALLDIAAMVSQTMGSADWRSNSNTVVCGLFVAMSVWSSIILAVIVQQHHGHCLILQECTSRVARSMVQSNLDFTSCIADLKLVESLMQRHRRHWGICSVLVFAATGVLLLELRSTRDTAMTWEIVVGLVIGAVVWPVLLLVPAALVNSGTDELFAALATVIEQRFSNTIEQSQARPEKKDAPTDKGRADIMLTVTALDVCMKQQDLYYEILFARITKEHLIAFFSLYLGLLLVVLEWL